MAHKWDPVCCSPPRGLVRPARVCADGGPGPTRGQAQGPRYRRVAQGWYVPSSTPQIPEQRILEQSVRLPDGGAVTGWASLRMWRANFFDGLASDGRTPLPVPLAVGQSSKVRGGVGVVVSREPLDPSEVRLVDGVPCTVVRRALFDEMRRRRDLREAVVAMDMAAAALLTSVSRMRAYWLAHRSWRRANLVARALELASEESRSPQESRVRLIWVLDAALPPPLVNRRVWDREGNLLGIADLLDVEAGLVGEFDGAEHRNAARHTGDVERQERFERQGLEVLRVTGLDVPHRRRVAERIHFHRSRSLWLPPERRTWTLTPPPGWPEEQSLNDLLDERDFHDRLHQEYERQGLM